MSDMNISPEYLRFLLKKGEAKQNCDPETNLVYCNF